MAVNIQDVINGSKIPDPIKFLPNYDGDTKTLHHNLQAVGNVLDIYANVQAANPAMFNIWMGAIRTKIIGKANEALIARNVGLVWVDIRLTLIDYFGDKRDLSTLCQKIPYLRQNNKNVENFYKEVNELTSNINQKVVLDERYTGHKNAVMTFVYDITMNAFIDGLIDPYNLLVRGFRPRTFEEAKSAAEEQIQSALKNKHFNQNTSSKTQPAAFRNNPRHNANQNFQNTQPQQYNQSNLDLELLYSIFLHSLT